MLKALGYGRISDAGGDNETSLPNQHELYKDYIADNDDLQNEGWYEDKNVSGDTPITERDGFSDLIDHLRQDEEIEIVLGAP